MFARIRGFAAIVALLGVLPAVGLARMAPTAPSPTVSSYEGSDGAGRISFKVYGLHAGNGSRYLYDLRFANECAATGTTVKARIKLDRAYGFSYRVRGVTVSGRLHRVISGTSAEYPASGTLSVDTGSCDSDPLTFTAKEQ
jgi:hypothetical protein